MQANRNRLGLGLGFFWSAVAVLAFAAPAQSQIVVQYTATLDSGFGDGPTPSVSTPGGLSGMDAGPDLANNGIPACNGLIKTSPGGGTGGTRATVPFAGLATVTTAGAPPRAVAFPAATRANGLWTTCVSVQVIVPPQNPTMRTQSSTLRWPGSPGSFVAGAGIAGPTTAPFKRVGTLVSGTPTPQGVTATTIPLKAPPRPSPKFGGALRVNGVSKAKLGIRTKAPPNPPWVGTLPFRLDFGASGTTITGSRVKLAMTTGTFMLSGFTGPPTGTQMAAQEFLPWTTGRVKVFDKAGQFWTFRTRSGFDNRNAAGTTGTLQLVAPALASITGSFLSVPFALTSVLTITFTPEPGAALLLAAGALTLLGLDAVRRRRS